jgi:hypothetical protein
MAGRGRHRVTAVTVNRRSFGYIFDDPRLNPWPRSQGASGQCHSQSVRFPAVAKGDREKNQFPYERSHDVVENKGKQFFDPTILLKTRALFLFSHNVVENIEVNAYGERKEAV